MKSERNPQMQKVGEVLKVFEGIRKKSDLETKESEIKKVTGIEKLLILKQSLGVPEIGVPVRKAPNQNKEKEKLSAIFGETKSKNLAKRGYKTPILVEETIVRKWTFKINYC